MPTDDHQMTRLRVGPSLMFVTGLVVGALMLVVAVRQVAWSSVATAVRGASPAWLALAMLGYAATQAFVALRWRGLTGTRNGISFGDAFDFLMIGAVASLVLPPRLGDVVRAVAAGRYSELSSSRMLGTIVIERLLDVVLLLGIGVGLSLVMPIPVAVRWALGTLLAAAVAASAVIWLGPSGPLGLLAKVVSRVRGSHSRLLQMLERFLDGIGVVREPNRIPKAFGIGLLVWFATAAAVSCTIVAFAIPAPWYAGAFVVLLINLGGLIPAPPAGIGVYHYFAMLAISPWAADPGASFAFALVSHAISVTVVLVLGTVSLARKGISLRGLRRLAEAGSTGERIQ